MLVLLIKRISEVRRWHDLRWNDVHTKGHDERFGLSNNIKDITSVVWEAVMLVLLIEGIY
jgi:hypothetical protein